MAEIGTTVLDRAALVTRARPRQRYSDSFFRYEEELEELIGRELKPIGEGTRIA